MRMRKADRGHWSASKGTHVPGITQNQQRQLDPQGTWTEMWLVSRHPCPRSEPLSERKIPRIIGVKISSISFHSGNGSWESEINLEI